jgi:hypothetical protein
VDIAHNLNHDLLDEFFKLWRAIEAANLNLQDNEEDFIVWNLESSGQFSTKSAYAIQFAGHTLSSFPSLIWEAWAPPQVQILPMAAITRQAVDCGVLAATWLEERLLLCPMQKEFGDSSAFVLQVPLRSDCLGSSGRLELV